MRPPDARPAGLTEDQRQAVAAIATSGRRLDVLVGPAGSGKTRTLRALRAAWESRHGRGPCVGLAAVGDRRRANSPPPSASRARTPRSGSTTTAAGP